MAEKYCESCMMPFSKDPGVRESDKYCSLCFRGGKFCYEGNDLKEFQKICYDGMVKRGMNPLMARFWAWTVRFAPRWKKHT